VLGRNSRPTHQAPDRPMEEIGPASGALTTR
jgi:hypothetical protein